MYRIEVKCSSEQMWRFNVAATCAAFNSAGERVAFEGKEHCTSEIFQQELVPHDGVEKSAVPEQILDITLDGKGAESLRAIIYFITHTLPENRVVEDMPPFAARVTISHDGKAIYDMEHPINQWGGSTIEITL